MLLGDGDIKILRRVFAGKLDHPGTFAHCRGNGHQLAVFGGGFAQPVTENFRIARHPTAAFWQAAAGVVELGYRVEGDRIFFRRFVASAFFGHDVQELRAFQVTHVFQRGDQPQHVMSIHRTNVVKAQLFKQRARHDHAFDVLFGAFQQLFDRGYAREDFFAAFAQAGVELTGEQVRQVVVQRPDVFGNRHLVVIEHHQHVWFDIARVVHRLKGHPGGDRAIANDADGAALFVLFGSRDGYPDPG